MSSGDIELYERANMMVSDSVSSGEIQDYRDQPGAIQSVTKVEIDSQIATAKMYPRKPDVAIKRARAMVGFNVELAADCTYELPWKDEKRRKITGPSVRLAEIMLSVWQNSRVAVRITEETHGYVTAMAVGFDVENNVANTIEVRRSILSSEGQRYTERLILTTMAAAAAIAKRNAIFTIIPRAFTDLVWEEAKRVAKGDIKTIPARTQTALDYFAEEGIKEHEVFARLGINGLNDMDLEKIQTLQGYRTAIKHGEATAHEIFRARAQETQTESAPLSATESMSRRLKERVSSSHQPLEPSVPRVDDSLPRTPNSSAEACDHLIKSQVWDFNAEWADEVHRLKGAGQTVQSISLFQLYIHVASALTSEGLISLDRVTNKNGKFDRAKSIAEVHSVFGSDREWVETAVISALNDLRSRFRKEQGIPDGEIPTEAPQSPPEPA